MTGRMALFISVVLVLFGLLSYYIIRHIMAVIPQGSAARPWVLGVLIFLSVSYPLARFLERVWLSPVTDILTWVSSFWLAAFFYFFLVFFVSDIVIAIAKLLTLISSPAGFILKRYIAAGAALIIPVVLIIGYFNAVNVRVKELRIDIDKPLSVARNHLRVVFASDIHLGTQVGPKSIRQIVEKINQCRPDLVLLGGDIVDEDLAPVIRFDLGSALQKIDAPSGVYGITGNHEFIGGAGAAVNYLRNHGVHMLLDEVVEVSGIYIAGRIDRDAPRFGGHSPADLSHLLSGVDKSKPLILLDHQPYSLKEKIASGIDLTLSGHTHHGQLWPLNYITRAVFDVSWGYRKAGGTHIYVSSGAGGWGPRVRIGNTPEIVLLDLNFKKPDSPIEP
ncbi:MAG: metallophosphoesterase [Bacteroidales bacterium]